MGFFPKIDEDSGETFNGFTQQEATFIINLRDTGSNVYPNSYLTRYIQMGKYIKSQQIVQEILAGRTFTVYGDEPEDILDKCIFYTSNMMFAKSDKLHSAPFNQDGLESVEDAYDTYLEEMAEAEEEEDWQERRRLEEAAENKFNTELETYMPISAPIVVEETAKRNIYFDNKKRMLYIDGKYYNTTFIKRSSE